MKYTVLVLRPDYQTSDYGQDTFLTWVEADNVEEAQTLAQREAYQADQTPGEIPGDDDHDESEYLPDYYILFVAEGHLNDIAVRE